MTLIIRIVTLIVSLAFSIANAEARRGGGGSSSSSDSSSSSNSNSGDSDVDISVDLDLSSLNAAIFSFYVIFIAFTLIQLISSYKLFRTPSPEEDFPRRNIFRWSTVLLIASLLTSYGLGATIVAHDNYEFPSRGYYGLGPYPPNFYLQRLSPAVYTMKDFSLDLTDILVYSTLLVLIQYRCSSLRQRMGPLYCVVPFIFLGITLLASISRLILSSLYRHGLLIGFMSLDTIWALRKALKPVSHLRISAYLLLLISFIFTCTKLWCNAKREYSPDHEHFDRYILSPIVAILCPILAVRAAYELSTHIVRNMYIQFNREILELVDIIVLGFIYLFIIFVMLGLGRIPKEGKDTDSEKPGR